MMNNYKFISKKLLEANEEIRKHHGSLNVNMKIDLYNIKSIEEIVRVIDKLSISEINNYAYKLSRKEIHMLIQYMPENIFDVMLAKIFKIIDIRSREEFLLTFFRSFQNHYSNYEFNSYFLNYLDKYNNVYEKLMMDRGILNVWKVWLNKKELVVEIINNFFKLEKVIDSYLRAIGLISTANLYKDCIKYFLTVGRSKDYLNMATKDIVDIIKTFGTKEMVNFLNNYLTKLHVDDFQNDVLEYIYIVYDTPLSLLNQFLWKDINDLAKDKYNIWYSKMKLYDFFRGDERFEFWYQYIKDMDARLVGVNSRQLFLDFGKFVVIEFKNIGNASYIYEKDYFEKKYIQYINRNDILGDSTYKNQYKAIGRVLHFKNWQEKTARLIPRLL